MIPVRDRMAKGVTPDRLKLEADRAARPLLIYLAMAALALAALAILLSNLRVQRPWEDTQRVRIAVDDASGVQPGRQEVRIAGLRVGTIVGADLHRGRAVLTLSLEDRTIYRDARIRLRPQSPLQDMYVDVVDRGTRAAGAAGGRPLPAERTRSSVDLGAVLQSFDADTRTRMQTVLDQLGRGLDDRGDQLRAAFAELLPFVQAGQRLTATTARRDRLTRRLVGNLRLVTDELAARDGQLTDLVADGEATTAELAANARPLDRLLRTLPPALQRLRSSFSTLRGTLDQLDPALTELRPTAQALRPGLAALRRVTTAARPALSELRAPVRRLTPLARDLRPTADRLDRAVAALRPQAPRLDRATAAIVPCELAVQKFFQWTPSVFKYGDAHGAYPRGEGTFGAESAGGLVRDPNLRKGRSCTEERR